MKKTAISAVLALSLASSTTLAGSLTDPIVVPDVIVEDSAASSQGAIAPLILLGLFLAVTATGGGGGSESAGNASDMRLKTGIVPVRMTEGGLTLYQFRYVGLPTVYEGVMAQEVLAHHPDALVPLPLGLLTVDYAKLGLEMRVVD